jgi:hypothetical protein
MEKFLISEKYRLDVGWDKAIKEREGVLRLEGCRFSGPVLSEVVGINNKDKILLDFGKQYRVFVNAYYVLSLAWDGFERIEGIFFLKNALLRSSRLEFTPVINNNDRIAIDTSSHDTNRIKITEDEGFIPLNYRAYLIKEDGSLYNFNK